MDNRKIFAANWKLNKSPTEAQAFVADLKKHIDVNKYRVFLFPQNFSLSIVISECKNSHIEVGPQHICEQVGGAFTGENSVVTAKEMGSQLVLIGHSERRQYYGETDELVALKIHLSQKNDVLPIFCIGETLIERESDRTYDVLKKQLMIGLDKADKAKPIVIAYEPVWAIGTGKVATLDQVKATHELIHEIVLNMGFNDTKILYGGSVKADNAQSMISLPYVDGFLIGGASLQVDSFLAICRSV